MLPFSYLPFAIAVLPKPPLLIVISSLKSKEVHACVTTIFLAKLPLSDSPALLVFVQCTVRVVSPTDFAVMKQQSFCTPDMLATLSPSRLKVYARLSSGFELTAILVALPSRMTISPLPVWLELE